jgi:hypothetical protein
MIGGLFRGRESGTGCADLSEGHHAAGRCGRAMLDEPDGAGDGSEIECGPDFWVLPLSQDFVGGAVEELDGVSVGKASRLNHF